MVRRAGLSISAIKVSELQGFTRIDSEFYQPHYLDLIESLEKAQAKPLSEIADIVKRKFEPVSGKTFNYIEISEVDTQSGHINAVEMNGEEAPSRAQYIVQSGDVIISSVRPNRNAVALISREHHEFVCSSGFVVLRPKSVSSEFLFASLKAEYVRILLGRQTTATMYPAVSESDLIEVPVIVPSKSTISRMEEQVKKAKQLEANSEQFYADTENLLASELGLKKFELPNEDITTQKVSDVLKVRRIDAEYFHPQKAFAKEWLGRFSGKIMSDYFESVRDIYNPPNQDTGKSILNFDLTHALQYFLYDDGEVIPENEIGSLKKRIQKNDVVVSRLRSYLKEIAIVEVPEDVFAVGSSEFIILRSISKDLLPEALLVYLRSMPVQTILKWSQDGSIQVN